MCFLSLSTINFNLLVFRVIFNAQFLFFSSLIPDFIDDTIGDVFSFVDKRRRHWIEKADQTCLGTLNIQTLFKFVSYSERILHFEQISRWNSHVTNHFGQLFKWFAFYRHASSLNQTFKRYLLNFTLHLKIVNHVLYGHLFAIKCR